MKLTKPCGQSLFLALALGASCTWADTLYVADSTSGNVYQFDTVIGAGSRALVSGSVGLNAQCIVVDGSGNLFLGNDGDGVTDFGDIYEITTNGTVKQIATGLNYPQSLAVDSQGDLFEAEIYTPSFSINLYFNEFTNTAGALSSTPIPFNVNGVYGPSFLTFDGSGDLFESDESGGNIIHVFSNYVYGFSQYALPTAFNNNNTYPTAPLAFDTNGDLLVGGLWRTTGPGQFGINLYPNTAGVLSSTPSAFYATATEILGIAIDSGGDVFYVDGFGTVQEFTNNAGTLSTTPIDFESFANTFAACVAIFHPTPVTPLPPQLLYVAANESVYSYSPALGSASQSTIASGLPFEPVAMAVDLVGNVFVSDGISTIYEIPTNGAPVLLSSSLNGPVALACDTNGNLFEADYDTASIYEFPNVSGSVSITPVLFASDGSFPALTFDNSGDLIASWGGGGNFVEYPQVGGILSSTVSYLPATENGVAGSLAFDPYGDLLAGFPSGEAYTPAGDGIFENVYNNSAAWYNGGFLAYNAIAVATENVAGLVCDTNGNLFVVDGDSGNVFEYSNKGGTFSPAPNLFIGNLGATCVAVNAHAQTVSVPTHNLYVSGGYSGVVYGYNTTNGSATQITLKTVSSGYAFGLAFDTNGNLFAGTANDVAEYVNNSGTLATTPITLSLFVDQATVGETVAFDQNGDMWVTDGANSDTYHLIYSGTVGIWNGAYGPSPWLPEAGSSLAFAGPTEQCVHIRGDLFETAGGSILEYGNMTGPIFTQSQFFFGAINHYDAGCLAFDGSGNLFVGYYGYDSGFNYSGFIYEYIASPGALSTTPTLFASGLGIPASLAFDASGNLFEAETGNSTNNGLINEFLNTSGSLSSTPVLFASGLETPYGMAINIPTPPPTAGIATKLAFVIEPPATTLAGATMAPFAVQIEDAFGNAVAQSGVSITVGGPTGLITAAATALTDATGLATFNNTSITVAGTGLAFSASTGGLSDSESSLFAVTPAPANTLVFTTEPAATTQAGVTMASIVVQIEDMYGNVVPQNGTAIMLGGVTLASGTTPRNTDAGGNATFNDIVIDTAGSGLVFIATSGLMTGSSTPFTITPAAPSKLVFTTEPPASTQAGATMATMVVQVEDLYGNDLSQNDFTGGTVILSGPAGLSGISAGTGAMGEAVFSGTIITVTGEDLALTASIAGLPGVTGTASTHFNIVPAPASKLAFLKEPAASTTAGMTMANVVLQIEDSYGNFVSQAGTAITIGAVTSGTDPVNTDAGGGASFNDLVIDTAGTGLVFTGSAPGLFSAESTPFAITPAPASQLVFTVEPASLTSAGSTMASIMVQIEDPYFNHIPQAGTAITLSGVTLASGTVLRDTFASGAAVFDNLVIDNPGAYVFTATSTGLTGSSTPFGISRLGPSQLAFTTEPAPITAAGVTMSTMVVQIEDLYGNVVGLGGTSVTLSGPTGLTGILATTSGLGAAIFSGTSIATPGVELMLTASSTGLAAATSTPFDITPPPLILAPQPAVANGMFQFTFNNNDPDAIFNVLFSTDLALPLTSWSVIGTASNISPGVFQYTDPQATNTRGYYRIRQ